MSGQMLAYKCDKCGTLHHPKHFVCKNCGHREFTEVPLVGECNLVTWTRVYNLPEGYMKPYLAFGIVKFTNGLVVSGQLEVDEPRIGMSLIADVGVVKEAVGKDHYGFIFRQAASA